MKLRYSILFILAVILMLAMISMFFPQPSLPVGGYELRFPSFDKMFSHSATADSMASADEMLLAAETSLTMQVVDSAQQAREDSLAFYRNFFANSPTRICCPNDNDPEFFYPFFEALDNASSSFVHVMHYGDSQIEGDRITGYLRSMFQKRFGGAGPGLLPLRQPVSAMHVQQSLSDSVTMYYAGGMMGNRASDKRYGAMAQVAHVATRDTLVFSAKSRRGKDFKRVTVFACGADSALSVSIQDETQVFSPGYDFQSVIFDLGSRRNAFSMQLSGRGIVYGVNISDPNGVSVTNLPLRGSDGTFFSRIEPSAMKAMLHQLNTRMVIMEFGGNALPTISDSASVNRWCNFFKAQIGYVRRMLPQAAVLVIGPADMSTKVNGELQTHPMLPYLVQQMRTSTVEAGAAFWDMYSVMGGYNSMIAWVGHKPSWAASDYVHFTKRGADRISEVLWESLMVYYDYRDFISNMPNGTSDDEE